VRAIDISLRDTPRGSARRAPAGRPELEHAARILILMVLALASCQSVGPDSEASIETTISNTGLVLETDRGSYAAGERIRLILNNRGAGAIGSNLCMSALERRDGQQWVVVPPPADETCTGDLPVAFPGGQLSYEFRLRPEMAAGEYRFRSRVEDAATGMDRDVVSNSFQVRR
jgi:uncharacterized protein YfaS (alpha-2-macroglobulin family)